MKKILLSLVAGMMAVCSMNAASITEARIYINPGHGSWTGGDRNMATINHATGDTTGFYESNTNLWKSLKLRQTLIDWGMPTTNIMMSRVKNGPYPHTDAQANVYNKDLWVIASEANAHNADYFISIHSNAGEKNFTVLIHKGYTTPAECPYLITGSYGSKEIQEICSEMAHDCWPYLTSNGIDVMAHSRMAPGNSPYVTGDFNLYYGWSSPSQNTGKAGYLGVLRPNTCPGFLSEGYAHEYMPAVHRALNPDYCGQEGVRYARGMAEYFGWEKEKTGYIMGSAKNMHERLIHKYYNYEPGSIDEWCPINDIEVTLYKGGEVLKTYKGDAEWNGVFMFEKLEPGDDYTIDVKAPGFKSVFELDEEYGREHTKYTVVGHETTYPVIYMEKTDYQPAPCYNYPNPDQPRWIGVAEKYDMRKDIDNKAFAVLEGKTIRRELAHGDSVYVLAHDADKKPYIYILNAKTQEVYSELSTNGVGDITDEREEMSISDIAFTSDSILVACNLEKTSFDTDGVHGNWRIYKWEKDLTTRTPTGDPEIWFAPTTSAISGNFSNAYIGQSLAISGRLEDCKVITTAETTGSSTEVRLPIFTITRKGLIEESRNQDKEVLKKNLIGDDYRIVVSPRSDNAIVVDGSLVTPFELALNAANAQAPTKVGAMSADVVALKENAFSFFKYGLHSLMAVAKLDADSKSVGVALYDVEAGLDKATLIETSNTKLDAAACNWLMVSSHVENDDITLFLHKDNKVSSFTTVDVEQVYYGNVYAYNLKAEAADGNYTFTYTVNEDCLEGGKLKFYDAKTGASVGEIALNNIIAGENSMVVAAKDVPGTEGQELKWAVEVSSKKVTHILPLLDKEEYVLNRAYATVDNSPESYNYGCIYVSNCAGTSKDTNGVVLFDQAFNRVNEDVYAGGITFGKNMGIALDAEGCVYVADANAANSGIWVAEPADMATSFTQFFEGERTSGTFKKDGVEVGGVTASISIVGAGANKVIYAYQKNAAGKYVINVYNAGEAHTWGAAPSKTIALPAEMIDDATIVAVEQGIWVGQAKTEIGNSETSPALMFVDFDGNVKFNSGTEANKNVIAGIAGSAIAVTKDGKMLVANDNNGVLQFYAVTWNESTPVLTHKYSYEHGIGVNAKTVKDGACIEQMAFDPAGRLVASGRYLGVFTVPTDNNTSETPAIKTITAGKASVAIESVEAEANDPVEYYNLQGVKVANPENGIFIKKQGNKATKVVL